MANSKDPKPVLGYFNCKECGERATVHQAGRRGHHLYKRCGCGCDQRVGDLVQSVLYYETAWIEGMKPEPPGNVLDFDAYRSQYGSVDLTVSNTVSEPENTGDVAESEAAPASDSETDFNPDREGSIPDKPKRKKSGFLLPALAATALGGLAWLVSAAAKARG